MRTPPNDESELPDARDGLTRLERLILYELAEAEREFAGRRVPAVTLYGRVVEHIGVSVAEFQSALARLTRSDSSQNFGNGKPRPGRANK